MNEKSQRIKLLTTRGYVEYSRRILRPIPSCKEQFIKLTGRKQIVPLDEFLGIHNYSFKITPRMMLQIAVDSVKANSYEDVSIEYKEKNSINISTDTVIKVTDFIGNLYSCEEKRLNQEALEAIDEAISIPEPVKFTRDEAGILCVMADGSYSPTRITGTTEWKDTKLAILFNITDCAKLGTKSFYHYDYACCVGSKEEFRPYLAGLLIRNSAHYYKEVCTVADGAPWIKSLMDELIPGNTQILDIFHLKEKIGLYFTQVCPDQSLKDRWIKIANGLVDRGLWHRLMELKIVNKNADIKTTAGNINLYRYIDNHKESLNYPRYALMGYTFASGPIESANKKAVQERFKGSGKRWNISKMQNLISLRMRYLSNGWDDVAKVFFEFCYKK